MSLIISEVSLNQSLVKSSAAGAIPLAEDLPAPDPPTVPATCTACEWTLTLSITVSREL